MSGENLSDLLAGYQKPRPSKLTISSASLRGCGEGYRPTVIAFNARLRNIRH
jgi:hypothetical protein